MDVNLKKKKKGGASTLKEIYLLELFFFFLVCSCRRMYAATLRRHVPVRFCSGFGSGDFTLDITAA